jgi:putative C-S lyase
MAVKSPNFDFDAAIDRAGTWSTRWDRYAGRDVIPLWVADTDFRPPPAVLAALEARVAHGVLGYTAAPDELRQAIVERLQRLYRWRVEPEWIVFLPGVVPGLHHAARTLTRDDDHIVVPTPVYQHLTRAAELAPRAHSHFRLVLEQGRWVFDFDALRKSLSSKTRLLFLCNPQNPGGTVFTREELLRLAELAGGLVIVSDEIHSDIVLDAHRPHVPIASLDPEISRRTVTLMSPNKSFNFPAAGCAWAIIEDSALRRTYAADVHAHALPSPSVFGFAASLAAYRDGDAWLAAQIDYLRANRDMVERTAAAWHPVSMAHVEATYLAWIDCSPLGLKDPQGHFLQHGVALSPGSQFGDANFVRLNFGTQRTILEAALSRMTQAVRAVQSR